jgi:maleylacetoacetate isomerase
MAVTLHGYWRSLATFRVRIALNLKGVAYTEKIVDLGKGEQHAPAYAALNPQKALPLLDHDGLHLTQSLAIMEYIEETWPGASLLPADTAGKARVRSLAQITIADVHPLIVPRVREFLEHDFGMDEPARLKWVRHWFDQGTQAIEARLGEGGTGDFAHGDQPTIADAALASHVAGAKLFQCNLANAPLLTGVVDRCMKLEAFVRAHPLAQPGAPAAPA